MTAKEQDVRSVRFYLPLEADDVAASRIKVRGGRCKRATRRAHSKAEGPGGFAGPFAIVVGA
jgi:hypothetical protein